MSLYHVISAISKAGRITKYYRGVFRTCQTSKMKRFAKKVNGFQLLTIFAKRFILDVWQGSVNASVLMNIHIQLFCYML